MEPYNRKYYFVVLVILCLLVAGSGSSAHPVPETSASVHSRSTAYIVQADTTAAAAAAVEQVGGTLTQELNIINSVAATLDPVAVARLRTHPRLTLHADTPVRTADDDDDDNETDTAGYELYPAAAVAVSALHQHIVATPELKCHKKEIKFKNQWHDQPLTGGGVTVAVVDTGLIRMSSAGDWQESNKEPGTLVAENGGRCLIYRDFVDPSNNYNSIDDNGHGTHVTGTIADNREVVMAAGTNAMPVGVAPQANMVIARALGADGSGSYADVIAAIDWIVANKDTYAIRVLNLSLYASVAGYYWEDPLNQAVMRAWQAGIVVVTVAGNSGSDAGTITAPGNVPYVITVGAMTSGRYTSSGHDELADYSSRGPTESAFVKPDVLVPATKTIASMPEQSYLGQQLDWQNIVSYQEMDLQIGNPYWQQNYYQLSGTSMAAAEVSGIVALILQANPTLKPDQVKYRLLATARPAIDTTTGEPLYSIWEQGAGLIDAEQAVFTTTVESANADMDIDIDLDPDSTEHYWGFTTWDEDAQEFQLLDPETGEPIEAWGGGRRSSSGSTNWLWTGGRRSSSGSTEMWTSGRRSSSGSTLGWAGSDMSWMQPSTQMNGMTVDLLVDYPTENPGQSTTTVWLPLVSR